MVPWQCGKLQSDVCSVASLNFMGVAGWEGGLHAEGELGMESTSVGFRETWVLTVVLEGRQLARIQVHHLPDTYQHPGTTSEPGQLPTCVSAELLLAWELYATSTIFTGSIYHPLHCTVTV